MSPDRTFSFESHDEHSLGADEQQYGYPHDPAHGNYNYEEPISPPPQYGYSGFHEALNTVSPTSLRRTPTHLDQESHYREEPMDLGPPEPVLYHDSPPPPPPHRTSPTRQSFQPQSLPYATMPDSEYDEPRTPRKATSEMPTQLSNRGYTIAHPDTNGRPTQFPQRGSHGSTIPLAAAAATPGRDLSPDPWSSRYSARSLPLDDYSRSPEANSYYPDSPYYHSGSKLRTAGQADIDPYNIADDGDDGFMPEPKRGPILPFGRQTSAEHGQAKSTPAAALGGLFGRASRDTSGKYGPVTNAQSKLPDEKAERSDWLARQRRGNNKMRWVVGASIGIVLLLALIGGIVGGVLASKNSSKTSSNNGDNSAAQDTAQNGDLDLHSAEIQALMNNKNLHKVFPAIDYTPWGTQYPMCLEYPPSQNNVTRDMAVLSQLTNTVRLYGTDCNATQMVLHAIDQLQLNSMKIWLGVWVDTNDTTNARQIDQLYSVIETTTDRSIYKGAIIGNEALYRAGEDKTQSENELISMLQSVRTYFNAKSWSIPVATSDLGDNWNAELISSVDYVMSNIHPFFAGVSAQEAAAWTWDFWQRVDVPLTAGNSKVGQIISETGWPSSGGTDCGGTSGNCTAGQPGSVASVENMNVFMSEWVCQSLTNGTEYFWFEAFDEPWKIVYDTPGKDWEDKWGLMDAGRNLKSGLQIPDCNGKTVDDWTPNLAGSG